VQKNEDISVIILAAGFSERMKTHKTELSFDSNRNFFQKITEEYIQFNCKTIIAVLNQSNFNSLMRTGIKLSGKIKIIINEHPEKGKFYSLKTGAEAIDENSLTFIQNIDNPFVNQNILHLLKDNSGTADYIIPSYNKKGGHPILISAKMINAIKNEVKDAVNMKTFFNNFKKYYIPANDEKILININTVSDYDFYF